MLNFSIKQYLLLNNIFNLNQMQAIYSCCFFSITDIVKPSHPVGYKYHIHTRIKTYKLQTVYRCLIANSHNI